MKIYISDQVLLKLNLFIFQKSLPVRSNLQNIRKIYILISED